ncbi:MAG: hypothetical protein V4850_26465 [Myxococcota bacterium]
MRALFLALPHLVGCLSEGASALPTPKDHVVDAFVAASPTEVDVLWVIDDSVSMIRVQDTLASAVEGFFEGYGAADVHVGLTTTDLDDESAGVVTWTDGDCLADEECLGMWQATLQVGNAGDDQERGLGAGLAAWSSPLVDTTNAGFAREGARHVLAVVSDEEDCTGGTGATGESCYDMATLAPSPLLTPIDDVLLAFHALDPAGELQVSGIFGTSPYSCDFAVPSVRYLEAVVRTGGSARDICGLATDVEASLADIATSAVAVSDRFRLTEAADPASLDVVVDGLSVSEDATNGWTYDAALWMVVLHGTARPGEGVTVTVDYTPL